jgi:rare lipoprotein A
MMKWRILFVAMMALSLSACTSSNFLLAKWKDMRGPPGTEQAGVFKVGKPYDIAGRRYVPQESYTLDETGIASWYGPGFHNKSTANGEEYDQYELTAAHRTLQLPSLVRVTNLENGKSVIVRVNDRGPFARGRIIDVSKRAADLLGFKNNGTARVRVQVLAEESRQLAHIARQGQSTKGYELALNEGKSWQKVAAPGLAPMTNPSIQPAVLSQAPVQPTLVSTAKLDNQVQKPAIVQGVYSPSGVRGHTVTGRFYPDPIVKQFPTTPTAIFIQVGAYGNPDSANKIVSNLRSLGPVRTQSVLVGGTPFYRVQIGPFQSVDGADGVLSGVINRGHPEARIVVTDGS